jgi:hypothetical protein
MRRRGPNGCGEMEPGDPLTSVGAAHADHGWHYDAEQIEFIKAMDRYKREHNRPYPTCSEVLGVARSLGYRKVQTDQTDTTSPQERP